MKLGLKHLSGYLPYKLPIKIRQEEQVSREEWKWFEYDNFLNGAFIERDLKNITPILHPLSDLTKHCDDLGFVPISKLGGYNQEYPDELIFDIVFKSQSYCVTEKLYEWHFDIYGLIEQNLAVDINTISAKKE